MNNNRQPIRKFYIPALLALLPLLLLSGSLAGSARAGVDPKGSAGQAQTQNREEEIVVRVYFRDRAERDRLAGELGADHNSTSNGFLTVVTTRAGYNQILARGLRVEIDQAATQEINTPVQWRRDNPNAANNPDTFFGGYRTVEEMEQFLDVKVTAYPNLAQKVDYGDSWCKTHPGQCTQPNNSAGYDLYAMRITNRDIAGPKPVFFYNAGLHSREIAPPELAMRYINYLLDSYNTDADAHWLVDHHEIWVAPMSNPDGHHIVEAGSPQPFTQRKNADKDDGCTAYPPMSSSQFGTDLNRNFPYKWNLGCSGCSSGSPCNLTYRGPSAGSEDETQALTNRVRMLIADQRGPEDADPAPITTTGVYLDMHSVASQNLYPWGWTGDPNVRAPNDPDLKNIANHMSALNAYPPGNNYQACQAGPCLYPTDGASDDWEYGELGAPSFTTELGGGSFTPPYSQVEGIWNGNRGMLLYLSKIARTPYLTTRGPDTTTQATAPITVTQGTSALITATVNYGWAGNGYTQNIAGAEYYIDTPPWAGGAPQPMLPVDGQFNAPTEAVQATIDTAGLKPGRHVIFMRGRGVVDYSGLGSWGAFSSQFLVVQGGGATATTTPTGTPTHTATVTVTRTPVPPTATSTSSPTAGTPETSSTPNITAEPATSTSTPTASPTPTIGPPCGAFPVGTQSTSCNGSIYNYSFSFYVESGCTQAVTRTAQIIFEAAPSAGGQYIELARDSREVTFPRGPAYVTVSGAITVTTIPAQYNVYRINILTGYSAASASASGAICRTEVTATPNVTVTATAMATPPVACTLQFEDVPATNTFYANVRCLSCRGVVGGYPCGGAGEPCNGASDPYFRPNTNVTRAQIAKIVSESAGLSGEPGAQIYEDVPPGNTFFAWVQRLGLPSRGIMGGYPCGGPGEPCLPGNRPYFRPYNNATRGQLAKIVANTAGFTGQPASQAFTDVHTTNTFYIPIGQLAARGIMGGYPCGGSAEPCDGQNRPYFRPNNNVTRGQSSKIVGNTFFPACP